MIIKDYLLNPTSLDSKKSYNEILSVMNQIHFNQPVENLIYNTDYNFGIISNISQLETIRNRRTITKFLIWKFDSINAVRNIYDDICVRFAYETDKNIEGQYIYIMFLMRQ